MLLQICEWSCLRANFLFHQSERFRLTQLSLQWTLACNYRTGLKLSTYFSAIKLHWMIKHYHEVAAAHEADDLMFGTIDSWIVYVSP